MAWAVILLLVLFALLLRVWNLDQTGLNSDELYTAKAALMPAQTGFAEDVHPPLFILLERVFCSSLKCPIEIRTRLPSAVSGTLLILLLAYVGYLVGGFEGALLAALLSAFDPNLVAISRLARSYMFASLLCGATFAATWALVRKPGIRAAIALGIVNALALYTWYFAVWACAAQLFVALVAGLRDRQTRRYILIANVIAGIAFLPWIAVLAVQVSRAAAGGGWVSWSATPYEVVKRAIQVFLANSPLDGVHALAYRAGAKFGAVAASLSALVVICLAWAEVKRRGADMFGLAIQDREGRLGLGLPAVYFALVFLLAYFAHAAAGAFIAIHYFVVLAAPIMALVILALFAIPGARARQVVAGLLLLTQFAVLPSVRDANREDLREAVRAFDQGAGPQAVAMTSAHFIRDAFLIYSARRAKFIGLPSDLPGHPKEPREAPAIMTQEDRRAFFEALDAAPEVWLVLSHETRNGVDRGGRLAGEWLEGAGYAKAGEGSARAVRWEKYIRLGFLVR